MKKLEAENLSTVFLGMQTQVYLQVGVLPILLFGMTEILFLQLLSCDCGQATGFLWTTVPSFSGAGGRVYLLFS